MTHSIDKYQLYASLNDDIINEHTKALNELLINKYIVAAHYSRVENIELIKSEGLRLLNKEEFAQRLMKIASRSDCTRKERDEFEEYLDLCQYFGHKKLNFFSLHDINTERKITKLQEPHLQPAVEFYNPVHCASFCGYTKTLYIQRELI